jgi:hypothetical protein
MSSQEKIAEKSLAELMQYLKNEELSLQRQMLASNAKLEHNRGIQAELLRIVGRKEQEAEKEEERAKDPKVLHTVNKGRCFFREKGSSEFCGKRTKKNHLYCPKHEKVVNG